MIRRQQGGRGNGDDMVLSIRGFQAGAIAGATLIGIMWAGTVWWTAKSARSPGDEVLYDSCLVSNKGNIIACDAVIVAVGAQPASRMLSQLDDALSKELAGIPSAGTSIAGRSTGYSIPPPVLARQRP